MANQRYTDAVLEELDLVEQEMVTGGIELGKKGFHATSMLEVLSVLDGSRGQVMVIVDGVIMNKDELGMI